MKSVRILQIVIAYINFIFMSIIFKDCFLISDAKSYLLYTTILFFISAIAYSFLEMIYRKKGILLVVIAFIPIFLAIYFTLTSLLSGNMVYCLLVDFPDKIVNFYNGLQTISFRLLLPYMIIFQSLIGIFYCTAAVNGNNKIQVGINIVLMIVLWFWHYQNILENYALFYSVIAIFTCIFDNYYSIYRRAKKDKLKQFNTIIASLLCPLFISIIVFSVLNNISLSHSGKYSDVIYEKVSSIGSSINTYDDLSEHKFSGIDSITEMSKEKIGGSLTIDNTPAFEVKASEPMYLKGVIKNQYDDKTNTWDYSYSDTNYIPSDTYIYDRKYSNNSNSVLEKSGYSTLKELGVKKSKVQFINYSNSIFYPYYTYCINKIDTDFSLLHGFSKHNSDDNTDKGAYDITYYDCENQINLDKAYAAGVGKNLIFSNDSGKTTFSKKEFQNYKVYNNDYMNGYSNIDKRVVELVKKIIKGSKSDAEKVYRIEQYLKNNYTYSLEVSDINSNLLYNFLFNEKKGYCVYFATAMTVMCMIANVPARYVEGVKMFDRKNSNGNYIVTNEDAHAWTEVMIDPKSNIWYIADATPTAAEYLTNDENDKKDNTSSITKDELKNDTAVKNLNINKESKNKSVVKKVNRKFSKATGRGIDLYKYSNLIKIIIILVLILALRVLYKIYVIKRAINSKNTLKLYDYCIKRLRHIGVRKLKESSEFEFAESIKYKELSSIMREIVEEVYLECYSDKEVTEFNKKEVYKKFEASMKKRQNIAKYYLFKYL